MKSIRQTECGEKTEELTLDLAAWELILIESINKLMLILFQKDSHQLIHL
jgi:hypothetical protein